MVINGSVKEYPVSLLLEILDHRRETGLLEISSLSDSAQFYFKDGKLIDAVLNKQAGMEARRYAERLTDGSFEFKAVTPAEYARLVWQHSLMREQLTERSNSLRSLIYAGSRELLANAVISSRSLLGTLKSKGDAVFVQASMSLSIKKRGAQATCSALLKSIAKRLRSVIIWNERLNERLLNSISDLKQQQELRLSRYSREFFSLLHRKSLPLNAVILILIGIVGISLIIRARWFEGVTNHNQIPEAAQQVATMDVASAVGSTLSKSYAAPVTSTETRLLKIQKTDEKEGDPRSTTDSQKQNDRSKRAKTPDSKLQTSAARASVGPSTNSQLTSTDSAQTVSVLVRVEDGHVSNASVIEPRPGLESYEAAALRVARQRRYPSTTKGFSILTVKIKK